MRKLIPMFITVMSLGVMSLSVISLGFSLAACGDSSSAPSDHTVDNDGVRHKEGLTNPMVNCVECHGADLKGGSVAPSCTSCHGQEW